MVIVVAQGIKDLGQSQMRQLANNILWCIAELPVLDHGTHGRAGARNDRLAGQDAVDPGDLSMAGHRFNRFWR